MKTILVVDDFDKSLYITELTIKKAGYEVLPATSGLAALKILATQSVDLIITDLNMPQINGIQLTEMIRTNPQYSQFANIPIIMLTTEINNTKKQAAIQAGVTTWIQKPYEAPKLIKTIEKALSI